MSFTTHRRSALVLIALLLAGAATLFGAGSASAHGSGYTCNGGNINSGWYDHLVIKGFCTIPDNAYVKVKHDIWVVPGGVLDAVTLATVKVQGDIIVGKGAVLGLGCTVIGVGCASNSDTEVRGSIIADQPLTMFIDGSKIGGDVISNGGGPGSKVTEADLAFNFAFKDNKVRGSVVLTGWNGGWMGAIRNWVGGNLYYSWNRGVDPDSNEIVHNTVGHNLACFANYPAAQFGDAVQGQPPSYGPNHVGSHALGQCASLV
ncbi:MAG TPA: hypothetical protein VMI11_10115 [Actinomycetes bacterium]|nr:hypothetical protein [Actinomycetes bacterium]